MKNIPGDSTKCRRVLPPCGRAEKRKVEIRRERTGKLRRRQFTLRYPVQSATAALAERIAAGPLVEVHFRRGDYRREEPVRKLMGELAPDYYLRGIARVRAKFPGSTLFIFSDDINAVEREFHPPGPHVWVKSTHARNDYEVLWLMSRCQYFIIANSTFSWWAAWLGNDTGKMVICPEP